MKIEELRSKKHRQEISFCFIRIKRGTIIKSSKQEMEKGTSSKAGDSKSNSIDDSQSHHYCCDVEKFFKKLHVDVLALATILTLTLLQEEVLQTFRMSQSPMGIIQSKMSSSNIQHSLRIS